MTQKDFLRCHAFFSSWDIVEVDIKTDAAGRSHFKDGAGHTARAHILACNETLGFVKLNASISFLPAKGSPT